MDSFVKCFDVVSMVVDEANSQFAPLWKPNEEKYKILKQYCEALDSLAEEFDSESFNVEIDDISMTIAVTMECSDITIQSDKHKFYDLAKRTISIGFSASKDGFVCVKFVFPSIWDKM